jgi:hypothetical protein
MSAKTGGPAFPQRSTDSWEVDAEGMALRDYFAAKAMQGMLASDADLGEAGLAKWAYVYADAMLAAREAK